MCTNFKLFLYSLDFSGITPQLRILKYDSYKSIFSAIISLIIMICANGFSIYSIIDYIKSNNCTISYLKRYGKESDSFIPLKDTLLMFNFEENSINNSSLKLGHFIQFQKGEYYTELKSEPCHIGKNINIKFKEALDKREYIKINEYYYISSENGNLSLFNNLGTSGNDKVGLDIIIFIESFDYFSNPYKFEWKFKVITENDLIDHDNKHNPIIPSLTSETTFFKSDIIPTINYNFEFIRYESDNRYFFKDYKNFMAITTEKTFLENENRGSTKNAILGIITFKQNELLFTHYKRSYQKIQSLLADMMSIVNILISIGKMISNILLKKNE